MNQLIVVVTFLVVYQQYPQIVYQNLLKFLHMNIILEIDLLLWAILVANIVLDTIQELITSTIIKKRKQIKN